MEDADTGNVVPGGRSGNLPVEFPPFWRESHGAYVCSGSAGRAAADGYGLENFRNCCWTTIGYWLVKKPTTTSDGESDKASRADNSNNEGGRG